MVRDDRRTTKNPNTDEREKLFSSTDNFNSRRFHHTELRSDSEAASCAATEV
jgi:hypothetical protein